MPLNAFDPSFRSFREQVLPELNRRGFAVIGMKPLSGSGDPVKQGVLTAEEALRYAMSLPVSVTISGVEKLEVIRQNLRVAQGFKPMPTAEMLALQDRCRRYANDGRFELYKVSMRYDNPEARMAHEFPIDIQQKEVKEMLGASENDGKPYPLFQTQG